MRTITSFKFKVSRKVGCVLTSTEVYYVSLADNFTVKFSKTFETPVWNGKQNSFTGPVITGTSRNTGPELILPQKVKNGVDDVYGSRDTIIMIIIHITPYW